MVRFSKLDTKLLTAIQDKQVISRLRSGATLNPLVAVTLLLDAKMSHYPVSQTLFDDYNNMERSELMVVYLLRELLQYVNGMKPVYFPDTKVVTKRQRIDFAIGEVSPSNLDRYSRLFLENKPGILIQVFGYSYKLKHSVPVGKVVIGRGRSLSETIEISREH